ncbi:hypothetical protein BDQ12DRAFT_665639 [Crucibulum laeve]|uniref:Uncharacterized protein n=1 Tax=Crucibulum laeve TaxID=68775 RepID=A0A5C3M4N5_9AGAR|nr:hypothetical protein BDQ12DRAFT_665639 [Crucibulum laeve]
MATPLGIPPEILKWAITQVTNTQTSRYNELAIDVLYLYDYVTTLDQEFQPMSFMKILFFLIKRLGFPIPRPKSNRLSKCGHWLKFQSGEAIVVLAVIQTILSLRIWAIYGRSNTLLSILGGFGLLQFTASSAVMGISLVQGTPSSQPGPGFFVCSNSTPFPRFIASYWIPILVFELTLFTLTVIKGWKNLRSTIPSVISGTSGSALLKILVRDSVLYFFLISAVYISNAAVWYWADLRNKYHGNNITGANSELELTTFDAAQSHVTTSPGTNTVRSRSQWDEWGNDDSLALGGRGK